MAIFAAQAQAGTFTTYAAWSDIAGKNRGRMYIYTGNYPSTTVTLYNATTPNTSMAAVYCGFPIAAGPYQPLIEVGSCPMPSTGGFGNNYFKCQSDNPIVWEVEENIASTEEDSHDFLAAADTTNYRGSVFMTFMRNDERAGAGADFGDQAVIYNAGATPITVNVTKWTGTPPAGSWGAVLATSPIIPAQGIWYWSPSSPAAHDRGGTDGAAQGHYKFVISGGTGMLYKGNTFCPFTAPGNRDNLIHFGPDVNDGTKVGDDLIGAVVTDGGAPHIVINNQGAAPANFEILKFNPTTLGAAGTWPQDGDDPTGTWVQVATGAIPVNASFPYNAGAVTNAGFYRVRSTNGQPLSAEFGSAILQQTWCDGDYLYASDTRRAFGRNFSFGGRFFNPAVATNPVQVHVVCPIANTTVNMLVDGGISGPGFINITQVNTVPDAGLAFPFARPTVANEDWHARITADKIIYVYIMSSTDNSSTAPGETFFSVPPPIDPILLVSKSVNKSVATLGDTLTYTLVAENPGSGNVTNARLWDTLASGLTFISATPPATLSAPPLYEWNLGTIGSNGSATVRMVVQVTAGMQLEIKHNTASTLSDLTNQFDSNDAPVTILIPGANLVKSVDKAQAMPGDTLTYILSYTNSSPPLPGTPRLNLEIMNGDHNTNTFSQFYRITNYSGANIDIRDLKVCSWAYDDDAATSVNFPGYYGGNSSPWAGWGGPTMVGTATAWAPPQTLPSNRKANLKLCHTYSTAQTLGNNVALDGSNPAFTFNSPNSWDNPNDDYSQNPGGSYVNDHHFALYYQNVLVTEYTNSSTPDPETGLEPYYVYVEDPVVGGTTFLTGSANAVYNTPYVSWTLDAVAPATTRSFTWSGRIPLGTPGGTVIPNDANYTVSNGPGLSNRVTTLVGSANVSLVKSINKNIFTLGETVTYCLAWSNTGTAAVNVTLMDTIDPVLTYVGSDRAPTAQVGNFIAWDLGVQAANTNGSVCFYAFINAYPNLPHDGPWKFYDPRRWADALAFLDPRRRMP